MILSFLKGCGLSASLALAIGPQNSFVLRRGLKRQQVFLVALTCSFFDAISMILGTTSANTFVKTNQNILLILRWGGFLFLTWYAVRSFRSAFKSQVLYLDGLREPTGKLTTIGILFALTFFNPHALIDSFVVIGGVAIQQPPTEQIIFLIGAIVASFIWFFSLAYGAFYLAPLFQSKKAWQILDIIVGLVMMGIASSLLFIDPIPYAMCR